MNIGLRWALGWVLGLLLAFINITFACEGRLCQDCDTFERAGDECQSHQISPMMYCDPSTNLITKSMTAFLECNTNVLVLRECTSGTYFQEKKGCVDPLHQPFMQASVSGSGRVGDICQYNTDCLNGMYCSGGVCSCLSTYIMRESYCYEKINPNQPGCTYDVQCEAVWPGARCSMESSIGTCKCPEATHIARETRDGWVCVSMRDQGTGGSAPLYFVCPLPEGAGFKIALDDKVHFKKTINDPAPDFNGFPVACTVGSSQPIEPVQGLTGGGGCIWPSTGEFIGDLYDCIHTSPLATLAKEFPQSHYSATADGVCCPSRALACIQPQVTGPNPTEPRWWYNTVTGTCQQFMWDPAASSASHHSANNFRTIQHCESYCRDTCTRGAPQYTADTAPSIQQERAVTACGASTSCANDFACTAVGSQHLCCPTPGSICSTRGGRAMDLSPRSTVFHPGFLVNTGKESIRFYYDPALGRCQDFVFRGSGGNFNNFLSKHECDMFCARLQCERGTPLRVGEDAQRCHAQAQCPSSHECKMEQGVCCPRKQTICAQPLRVGDCTENVKRYWYNAKTRQCQMFEYTGCQGNDNNFATILDCQNFCKNAIPEPKCIQGQAYKDVYGNFVTCQNGQGCPQNHECYFDGNQWGCCPTKPYTCSLAADPGIQCGAGSTFKFYYNTQSQNCDSFQYNGCDGNSNNFATRETCEHYCSVGGCPNGGTPHRDHFGQITVCSSQESCPDTHECMPVLVGQSTIHRCCPTRGHMCSLPPQTGTQCGAQPVQRYYFNIVTGSCTSFQFGGCDANHNNFLTMTQCRNFCMSNACPAGNIAYIDPNTQLPIECNEALSNSCPPGYECTFNPLTNGHVCCGATEQGVCPDGEKAFVDVLSMSPRECLINLEASCPANYLCRFNIQKNKYYCCSHIKDRMCPTGRFLYKDTRTRAPVKCTIGKQEQCADGYSCQSYLPEAFQGFCCTTNSICPDDAEYLVDESSHLPRACTMGAYVSCPSGFLCRSYTSSTEGFCCRGSSVLVARPVTDGCPPGNFVWLVGSEPGQCDPFNPPNAPCPEGFTCQWSTANQRYQCCGSSAPVQPRAADGCPSGQVAYRETGTVRVCTAGATNCPAGYFCQFSNPNNQFQCCGVSAGCPEEGVAFIGVSGEAEKCVVGQSQCPAGFACLRTVAGHHTCCTARIEHCTDDQVTVDGRCLDRAYPTQKCESMQQCAGGSLCQAGECVCPKGTSHVGKYCQKEIAPPDCQEREIMAGGMCLPIVGLEDKCTVQQQCPDGATCAQGLCVCKQGMTERNGKCIHSISTKATHHTCSVPSATVLLDDDTGRVVPCRRMGDSNCPKGYECQINSKRTQYICCSIIEGTPPTVATTIRGRKYKKTTCPPKRTAYLVNGQPQKCFSTKCPQGYECLYSYGKYVCCSAASGTTLPTLPSSAESNSLVSNFLKKTLPTLTSSFTTNSASTSQGTAASLRATTTECARGEPLLHPSTQSPVLCSNRSGRTCPTGYSCVRSLVDGAHICCSTKMHDIRRKRPCEGFAVLVTRIHNGKLIKRCERSCPYPEVPIGGVCYEMRGM
ncbi:unnamed protein product, partial [Mesorhabditis spiculigera]